MRAEDKDKVTQVVQDTFKEVLETGFEQKRIDAILHRTELSLKVIFFSPNIDGIKKSTPYLFFVSRTKVTDLA